MGSYDAATVTALINCSNVCAQNTSLTEEERMSCLMQCYADAGLTDQTGAFSVAITLRNLGSTSETVTIKAGTVLTPDSSDYQRMMLIQDIDLTTSPGDTDTFMLPVYCLDPDLKAPDSTNSYTISEITEKACLRDILLILATKNIDSFDYSDSGVVQTNIWNCMTGEENADDTQDLNNLPDL